MGNIKGYFFLIKFGAFIRIKNIYVIIHNEVSMNQ